ncbi:hypothetical protein BDY19DRAFT_995114 [Irpex rosettiformis]|uniref:Uncharacterized protein n=1 Tax=Irpex rosettiformis TaxID=378272 RepID=A0ACB8TZQ5_9APHY|nr:hypothetical protein BDY19DRAFT_995114 [Irpex rosettiformis]
MSSSNDSISSPIIRPMPPPFHALGLQPSSGSAESDSDRLSSRSLNDSQTSGAHWNLLRQSSMSSVTSSCATSTSVSMGYRRSSSLIFDRDTPTPPPSQVSANGFSLVLTSFINANAFVVVPAPQPYVPAISTLSRANASIVSSSRAKQKHSQALILVGPAAESFRQSRMRVAKGTRVHPYRIVSNTQRRAFTSPEPLPTDMQL